MNTNLDTQYRIRALLDHERRCIWDRISPDYRFIRGYIECALWSSNDSSEPSGGDPLDKNYNLNDLSDEALLVILDECRNFIRDNADFIAADMERAGHDFWLTRNRHGAGFWDGDWPAPFGKLLTDNAHAWGSTDIYIGDDGKLHLS